MKVSVVDKKERRLPKVGEAFRCADSENIYIRIEDEAGCRALKHDPKYAPERLYGVSLNGGFIGWLDSDDDDIEILEPVDGELRFRPITN
jgi:hypothetical protein